METTECKKVKFATEEFALFYVDKLQKTSIRDKKPIKAYLCQHCVSWHLSSKESYAVLYHRILEKKLLETELLLADKTQENLELSQPTTRKKKELEIALKADMRIVELKRQINAKDKKISKLQKDNNQLIIRLHTPI